MTPAADRMVTRDGEVEPVPVSPEPPHVIEFPAGLPGFENCRRFVLIALPDLAPLSWVQALDAPEPAFLTIDPTRLDPAYDLTLREFDRTRLGATTTDALVWLAIVTVTPNGATANLRAPIVICPRRMTACQFIRDESDYPLHCPLELG